jgi:hypothetical protein
VKTRLRHTRGWRWVVMAPVAAMAAALLTVVASLAGPASTVKARARRSVMALGAAVMAAGALMSVPTLVPPASASSGADIAFQDSNPIW